MVSNALMKSPFARWAIVDVYKRQLFPMLLIILQRETGSALVYSAFFLMLYREGMPGVVLFLSLIHI